MNYNTIADIRNETGLVGDPSVSDELIQTYLRQSTDIVLSSVAAIYNITNLKPGIISESSQAYGYLKRCESLLASGYLLVKLYGGDIDGDKNGYDKINEGKALLAMMIDNTQPLRLIDESGLEYAKNAYNQSNKVFSSPHLKIGEHKFSVDDTY